MLSDVVRLLADEFEVVGTVRDAITLLERAVGSKPDVVVTDYKMPGLDGTEAGRRLLAAGHCKAVVLLTLYNDPSLVQAAAEAGIRGYVLKFERLTT
jgi:DNA-binding NarL/FixJ family response regulator